MLKLEELQANTKTYKGTPYIELTSVATIDNLNNNVIKTAYDLCPLTEVNELTTVLDTVVYATGKTETQKINFIRINGMLKLVSKKSFDTIEKALAKNKIAVEKNIVPINSELGKQYIECFYKFCY